MSDVTDRAATEVQAWLEPRADEMAQLLCELVAIDTENPPGRQLGRCGRLLRDSMERLGLSAELIEVAPSRELEEPCVVRASVGDGPGTIYFHGHFDVVPAQDPAQFHPARHHGRITGRGSADMKGGLVSMLYGPSRRASSGSSRAAGSCCISSATRRPAASPAPGTSATRA